MRRLERAFGCHFRQFQVIVLRESRLLRVQEVSESLPRETVDPLQARLEKLDQSSLNQLISLLDQLPPEYDNGRPSKNQYAKMQKLLSLLGYYPNGKAIDETAILNTVSALSIELKIPFSNPLAIFRTLRERLGVSKAKITEARTEQDEKERRQALTKLLPHQANPELQQKINALSPEQIRRILRPLYWAVYTEEESAGLKNGGYQKNKQAQSIQEALSALGYYKGNPDGIYGPQTRLAVKKLQLDLNETDDGAFGNKTFLSLRNLLELALAEKKVTFHQRQEENIEVLKPVQRPSESEEIPAPPHTTVPPVPRESKRPIPLSENAIPDKQPDTGSADTTSEPAGESDTLTAEKVREKIALPDTPKEHRQILQDWLVQKELSTTHADYLQKMAVHGPEVALDIANLKASDHIDPRNYPDNTEYMAHDESGNATRLFVNFHGEPYFSITRDPLAAQFGLRLMGKLGDPDHLFMYHISRQEMVPVVPAASSDQKDLYAEKGGKERIFHQSGIEALPNVYGEYEFFSGPPELQSKKFLKRTGKNGKVSIVKGEQYPDGENAKK